MRCLGHYTCMGVDFDYTVQPEIRKYMIVLEMRRLWPILRFACTLSS